jgi:hypothetical protein
MGTLRAAMTNRMEDGAWHFLEPVSFDLIRGDSIRNKAPNGLGELTSVKYAQEHLKVYLLVGKPQADGMNERFEKALGILQQKFALQHPLQCHSRQRVKS